MHTKEELDKFLTLMLKLTEQNFYGKLTVSFEKGKIVHLKREETIKLPNLASQIQRNQ